MQNKSHPLPSVGDDTGGDFPPRGCAGALPHCAPHCRQGSRSLPQAAVLPACACKEPSPWQRQRSCEQAGRKWQEENRSWRARMRNGVRGKGSLSTAHCGGWTSDLPALSSFQDLRGKHHQGEHHPTAPRALALSNATPTITPPVAEDSPCPPPRGAQTHTILLELALIF